MRGGSVRVRRPLMAAGLAVLALMLLVSAATPGSAQAASPLSTVASGIGSLFGGVVGGGIAQVAVSAFEAIIQALFAPIAKFVTTQLIGWLVTVPNLTQGNVASLERTVEAMGIGALGAIATFSGIRYWLSGLVSGGDAAFAGLEGLVRGVGAVLFLAVWPWLFDQMVHLTNLFTGSLLGSGSVVHSVSHLLAAGLGNAALGGPLGMFLEIAIAVIASLLFLGLLLLKIVVTVSTILVFVGMPLAVVAWPLVPWVARLVIRAFAVCLIVPMVWALCFAASAAVSLNAISFNAGSALNTMFQPLVGIVLLYMMVRLPTHLARVAMLGAAPLGGGFVSRAVSYAAGSQARDTARQHLPGWAGGHASEQTEQREPAIATRLRTGVALAGAAATGGATAATATAGAAGGAAGASQGAAAAGKSAAGRTAGSGAATADAAASGGAANPRAYSEPAIFQAAASGQAGDSGLQNPAWNQERWNKEMYAAQKTAQTNPVTVGEARQALANLPENTRRGVAELASQYGKGAREYLAHEATGEWMPEERAALRALAAATPKVRDQAITERAYDASVLTDTAPADMPATGGAAGEPHGSSGAGGVDTGDVAGATGSTVSDPTSASTTGEGQGLNEPARDPDSSSPSAGGQPPSGGADVDRRGPASGAPQQSAPGPPSPSPAPPRDPRDPNPFGD